MEPREVDMTFEEFEKALVEKWDEMVGIIDFESLPDMPTRDWYDSCGGEPTEGDFEDFFQEAKERADFPDLE